MISEIMVALLVVWGIAGWLKAFREQRRSRDYATDLSQVIHDYELGRDDLRRSLRHDEIEKRVDRE